MQMQTVLGGFCRTSASLLHTSPLTEALCFAQVKLEERATEAQEPREVFDFRGNKQLDLGFGGSTQSAAQEGLTWAALKAVCGCMAQEHSVCSVSCICRHH